MPKNNTSDAKSPPLYYPLAIALATPLYRLLVWRKSKHKPSYQREINERFGQFFAPAPIAPRGVIWCHAVSLGELNTAYPLLQKLLDLGFGLWISSTTQTGFDRAAVLFADEIAAGRVAHSFVPIDRMAVLERFLAHIRPVCVLFIETELWANMLHLLAKHGIKSVMVNARLSEKSYQGYAKFAAVSRSMMANINKIIAQNQPSVERFLALGASPDQLVLADSLKWSVPSVMSEQNSHLSRQMASRIQPPRPIWVMASTHAGEETLALAAHQRICQVLPDALLILVPRHPERFDEAYHECLQANLTTARRSSDAQISPHTQVFLADSLGELMAWYNLCDVAVVGGSFVPVGGHNPIEPASLAKPIIMGRYTANCQQLVDDLQAARALVQLDDADTLSVQVIRWLTDTKAAEQAGAQAQRLVQQKRHALQVQLDEILAVMV